MKIKFEAVKKLGLRRKQDRPVESGQTTTQPGRETPQDMPGPRQALQGPMAPRRGYEDLGLLVMAQKIDRARLKQGVTLTQLDENERAPYEVFVGKQDGLLYRGQGDEAQKLETRDTGENGEFMYAMDKKGHIYAASESELGNHSAFLAGGRGAAFGTVRVVEGLLKVSTDESGHYQPTVDHARQFERELKARGAKLEWHSAFYRSKPKKDVIADNKRKHLVFERYTENGDSEDTRY